MKNPRHKTTGNKSLFDEQFTALQLSEIGNPLEIISQAINFNMFREKLEEKLLNTNKKTMQEQALSML